MTKANTNPFESFKGVLQNQPTGAQGKGDAMQKALLGSKPKTEARPWDKAGEGMQGIRNVYGKPTFTRAPSTPQPKNPMEIPDLAQAGMEDIANKAEARRQQQALAQQAYFGVEQSYGEAVDQIMQSTEDARLQGRQDYEGAMQQGKERMGEASGIAAGVREEATKRADQLMSTTDQWREEALSGFQNKAALAANGMRLGMEQNFNQRMANIDSMATQGKIGDAEGAKNQLRMEHSRQLGTVMGQLDVEYSKLNTSTRAQIDSYSLQIKQAAEATRSGVGVSTAAIQERLAQAEAQNASIAAQQQQEREIQRVQLEVVGQQLKTRGQETMAEILLSPAMAPTAIEMLPLLVDLYDMYEFEEQQGASNIQNQFTIAGVGGVGDQAIGSPRTLGEFGQRSSGGSSGRQPRSGSGGVKVKQPQVKPKAPTGGGGGGGNTARGGGGVTYPTDKPDQTMRF